ncbi:MAG: glycosyltransferase [Betaproteobacteria bacterium]
MSDTAAPCDCSVILIALAGGEALAACLRRIAPWHDRCQVMLGEDMEDVATWQARLPGVRFAEGRGQTVPVRRQRGVEAVHGQVVALLEDTSLPEPGWLEAMCEAFANASVAAAGGPVRIDSALGARYRALACTEYGRFHPDRFQHLTQGAPDAGGTQPVSRLPGNNLAYRREHLLEILKGCEDGLFEGEVNEVLKARGYALAFQPRMAVVYAAADPHGARLGTRMQHGRLYAGQRVTGRSYRARLAWFAGSLLLPVVLSARGLASMTRAIKPAAWPETAFWICLMETAWAIGESVGYLVGAGRSVKAWR